MIYFISDCHFGHKNVIQFDNRPFNDVTEMDTMMMEYWKMRVQKDDEVYIVGDFCYRSDKDPVWYLQRLPGKKHLVQGNHDDVIMKDSHALSYFESVDKMMHVSDKGRQICLCHFPLAEWHSYYRESYHIYGHIHNRLSDTCLIMRNRKNAYNAAACINNYMPSTLDEIIANNKRFVEENSLSWRDLLQDTVIREGSGEVHEQDNVPNPFQELSLEELYFLREHESLLELIGAKKKKEHIINPASIQTLDDRALRWYRKHITQFHQECLEFEKCYKGDPKHIFHEHFKGIENLLSDEIERREQYYKKHGVL